MQGDRVMQYRELVYKVARDGDQLLSEEDMKLDGCRIMPHHKKPMTSTGGWKVGGISYAFNPPSLSKTPCQGFVAGCSGVLHFVKRPFQKHQRFKIPLEKLGQQLGQARDGQKRGSNQMAEQQQKKQKVRIEQLQEQNLQRMEMTQESSFQRFVEKLRQRPEVAAHILELLERRSYDHVDLFGREASGVHKQVPLAEQEDDAGDPRAAHAVAQGGRLAQSAAAACRFRVEIANKHGAKEARLVYDGMEMKCMDAYYNSKNKYPLCPSYRKRARHAELGGRRGDFGDTSQEKHRGRAHRPEECGEAACFTAHGGAATFDGCYG
ncbi:unnamed protein product [Symbiodinium microadriaticum]|nr:unnamed protein product [Symbiodinium microadriaticum]